MHLYFFLYSLILLTALLSSTTNLLASAAEESSSFASGAFDLHAQHIQKINSSFYVAQMKDHDLRLVMERVDDNNITFWKNYSSVESHGDYPNGTNMTKDGSDHFRRVLGEISRLESEIWVAYVTHNQNPEKHRGSGGSDGDIEMFVTVTSTPEALITSHMGVSTSRASLKRSSKRPKGISIDLHSFAAKVMLMQNPKRRYMVNAPNDIMRSILAKALRTGDLFVGTKEDERTMQIREKTIQNRASVTFEEFKNSTEGQQVRGEVLEELGRKLNAPPVVTGMLQIQVNNKIKNRNTKEIEELLQNISPSQSQDSVFKKLKELMGMYDVQDGKFIPSKAKQEAYLSKVMEEKIKSAFDSWQRLTLDNPWQEQHFNLMKQYPPLLSVDIDKETRFIKSFTLYDSAHPTQPWLVIDERNRQTYNWMFKGPFLPQGTNYVVVDLRKLANAKHLGKLKAQPTSN